MKAPLILDANYESRKQEVNENENKFVQLKIHKIENVSGYEVVIQIMDISLNIFNKQIQNDIDLENKIRGWVCHELQNPLNSILNSSELLEIYVKELLN